MIRSYVAVHHDEEYDGQYEFEKARARQVARLADAHGIDHRFRRDGDTTYLDASVKLPSVESGPEISDSDDEFWTAYIEFLQALEDSNLGYLLHEVDTEAEKALVEDLVDIGDDSPSLRYVDVDFRPPEKRGDARYEGISVAVDGELRHWVRELAAFVDIGEDAVVAVALGRLREDHGGSDAAAFRINDEILDYDRTNAPGAG